MAHKPTCKSAKREWSGAPDPKAPDTYWLCDECGGRIKAAPGRKGK